MRKYNKTVVNKFIKVFQFDEKTQTFTLITMFPALNVDINLQSALFGVSMGNSGIVQICKFDTKGSFEAIGIGCKFERKTEFVPLSMVYEIMDNLNL